jgi:hypothetical protein
MTMSQPYVAPPGWQPPPPRPPLTPRQKSGARLAGIIGFLLLSVGFGLFSLPLAVLAFGAFFAIVLGFIRTASQNEAGFDQFMSAFAAFDPTAWILPLVIAAVVGLVLMVLALVASARILRAHDVARPWPVTWAGAGIAIVGSWLLSGLSAVPFAILNVFRGDDPTTSVGAGIAVGVVSLVLGLVLTGVIGWLSWWWMAHALRAPATPPQARVLAPMQ